MVITVCIDFGFDPCHRTYAVLKAKALVPFALAKEIKAIKEMGMEMETNQAAVFPTVVTHKLPAVRAFASCHRWSTTDVLLKT